MSAGSRVLVLAIPATVLTHSSPAMLAVLAVLAVYDPVELSQAGAIRHKLYTVFYLLVWPGLACWEYSGETFKLDRTWSERIHQDSITWVFSLPSLVSNFQIFGVSS